MFVYEKKTNTIRKSPEGYLIAIRSGWRWIADVDMALPENTAVDIFKIIRIYGYIGSANLVERLNQLLFLLKLIP